MHVKPTVGRIVHYVLDEGPSYGQTRPAVIVRVWTDTCVTLQVFTDAHNDGLPGCWLRPSKDYREPYEGVLPVGGTWFWPPRT